MLADQKGMGQNEKIGGRGEITEKERKKVVGDGKILTNKGGLREKK